MILAILVLRNTVGIGFYKPSPNRKSVLFPSGHRLGNSAHLNLGNIRGSWFSGYRMNIIVNDNCRVGTTHKSQLALAILIVITVKHVPAQRFADIFGMFFVVC